MAGACWVSSRRQAARQKALFHMGPLQASPYRTSRFFHESDRQDRASNRLRAASQRCVRAPPCYARLLLRLPKLCLNHICKLNCCMHAGCLTILWGSSTHSQPAAWPTCHMHMPHAMPHCPHASCRHQGREGLHEPGAHPAIWRGKAGHLCVGGEGRGGALHRRQPPPPPVTNTTRTHTAHTHTHTDTHTHTHARAPRFITFKG